MIFKNDWKKTDQQVKIPPDTIQIMVEIALPGKKLVSHEVISGGCALSFGLRAFACYQERTPRLSRSAKLAIEK